MITRENVVLKVAGGKGKKAKNLACTLLRCDVVADTPIMRVLPRAWVEVMDKSPGDFFVSFDQLNNGIAIEKDGAVVAFLLWREDSAPAAYWVTLGWVQEEYRGAGMYQFLWDTLVATATEKGIHAIFGTTSTINIEMQRAMEKQGRKPVGILYRFSVNDARSAAKKPS